MKVQMTKDTSLFGLSAAFSKAGDIVELGEPFRVTPDAKPSTTLYYAPDGSLIDITADYCKVLHKYAVDASLAVEYVDYDAPNERGIKTIRKRCTTTLEAIDEADAQEKLKRAALPYFPGCWQLIISRFDALCLTD